MERLESGVILESTLDTLKGFNKWNCKFSPVVIRAMRISGWILITHEEKFKGLWKTKELTDKCFDDQGETSRFWTFCFVLSI